MNRIIFTVIAAAVCSAVLTVSALPLSADDAAEKFAAAVCAYDCAAIRSLAEKGANVNVRGDEGFTALMVAARKNDAALAKLLVSKGAALDAVCASGATALIIAAQSGSAAAAKLLVEKGASVSVRDSEGFTAYDAAVRKNNAEIAALLGKAPSSKGSSSEGIILGTTVNLRAKPDSTSKVLAQAAEGDAVTVLDHSGVKESVGQHSDEWVKVLVGNGASGYVFGAYLFDLGMLEGKRWVLESCSGVSASIEFSRGRRCVLTKGCSEPECGEPQSFEGTYTLEGRRIRLELSKGASDRELYLYRYKGRYALSSAKYEVDRDDSGMGDCGLWFQY